MAYRRPPVPASPVACRVSAAAIRASGIESCLAGWISIRHRIERRNDQRACGKIHRVVLLWQIVIGVVAGWLAGQIMRGRGYGVLIDLLLGVVGSMLGGFIFGILGLYAAGLVGRLVVATGGALLLIYIAR